MTKQAKGNWLVRIKQTVYKELVLEDCTEDQAREDPFDFSVDEIELDAVDYEVQSVRPDLQ